MQEKGVKSACALPLELKINAASKSGIFSILAQTKNSISNSSASGIPYYVIAYHDHQNEGSGKVWNFALAKNDSLQYDWKLDDIAGDRFSFAIHGPNGFYRSFESSKAFVPSIEVNSFIKNGKPFLNIKVHSKESDLLLKDKSYQLVDHTLLPKAGLEVDCSKSNGWYDIEITSDQDKSFRFRYAGHIENGEPSITDPLMGGVV